MPASVSTGVLIGLAVAVTVFVATLTLPLAERLARAGFVDHPNDRSMHRGAVSRAGGVALVIGVSIGALVALLVGADESLVAIVGVACLLGAVGLFDDRFNLPGTPRLAAQLVVGVVILELIADPSIGPGPAWPTAVRLGVVLAWTLGVTNAVNFMDGVNGLTGVLTVVFGIHLAVLAGPDRLVVVPAVLLAAGAVGFLPSNFASGRVFLGDGGAYFIGAWLAAVVVLAVQREISPVLAVAPFAVYAVDTAAALVPRMWRREALLSGHRDHVYQRVVLGGWSHTQSALLVAATASVCAGAAQLVDHGLITSAVGLTVSLVALAAYLAVPHLQHRRRAPIRSAGSGG